ncbi:MAG: hypothetical protein DRQ02_11750 [Candidatus Latescibacterota bacterium]|nr:MAG: hypothetical protein DRQ02_11750 [Candidatus Latescibacterota bacterium]RKY70571.1 MAG: hypothetical protein DRQ24_09030 [Candidatus Latescibacterota bacterium]
MLRKQPLTAICALLLLPAMFMPWEAFGQADSLEVEIIWEKQFDSEVQIRPGTWPSTVAVQFLPEPYVGIDWSVPEGKNPVVSVVTQNSIYILDQDGKLITQIPLDRTKLQRMHTKDFKIPFQAGGVSPDGRYYVIYDKLSDYEGHHIREAHVFTVDGTPVIELSGPDAGEVMFSPNGKLIVVFRTVHIGETHIAFYDNKFNLIRKLSFDFETSCFFSADGSAVFVEGDSLLKFDGIGKRVDEFARKEFFSRPATILGASHERRILLRQKLREKIPSLRGKRVSLPREQFIAETKAALESKSPERIEEITRETRIRSRQGITLSPSGRYGVFNTESTLILFKITK